MSGDDGAVPQAGAMAVQPAMPLTAAHMVPDFDGCGSPELLRAMDAIDEAAVDPMQPLDFGIDLNDITGVTEHGTLGLSESAPAPQPVAPSAPSFPPLEFAVVPSEPMRDGMVPAFPGHYSPDLPGAAAGPQVVNPTARALGNALFWSFSYALEAQRLADAAPRGFATEAGPDGTVPAAAEAPAEMTPLRAPRARAMDFISRDGRSRAEILARWREKKTRRLAAGGRTGGVQYESRKRTALVKPRINGKFVTHEVYKRHLIDQGKPLHTVPTAE